MIYIGLAQNITPLVTVIMSYFMTGEKLKLMDILMIFITFCMLRISQYGKKALLYLHVCWTDLDQLMKLRSSCGPLYWNRVLSRPNVS